MPLMIGKNTMKIPTHRFTAWLALITLCLAASNAEARPPRAQEMCGVLKNIDPQSRTLTLASENAGDFSAVWRTDTRFLKNWRFDSVSSLQPGGHACVFYRTPFFGKPFVTKVIWKSEL
jgi:hypothetical protein